MKYHLKFAMPVFILVMAVSTQCTYKKEQVAEPYNPNPSDCSTVNAKFGADVLPLMTNKCATAGCHDATASGGRVFQTYSQISSAKERINVRAVIEKTMPQGGSLSTSQINILKCWIANGAPND